MRLVFDAMEAHVRSVDTSTDDHQWILCTDGGLPTPSVNDRTLLATAQRHHAVARTHQPCASEARTKQPALRCVYGVQPPRCLRWHRDELGLSTSSGYSLETTPLDRLLRLRMVIRGHHLSDSTASTKGVPADRRSPGRLRAIHRLTLSFPKQVSLLVPTGKAAIDVELLAPIELPRIAMNAHSTPLC